MTVAHHPPHVSSSPGFPCLVRVAVTNLWAGADRVRDIDVPVVGATPDLVGWLAAMDGQSDPERGRLGLHGRVLTQLVEGEPVRVIGTDGGGTWSQVLAPWQPSPGSDGGYPGWVPSVHLRGAGAALGSDAAEPAGPGPVAEPVSAVSHHEGHPALGLAREHLGLRYLWGGLTPLGLDCSGLVHHTWRRLGLIVPRDAYAQAEASGPVPLGQVQSGDLYFFAHPDRRIHHVGIVVSRGRMLHASETGGVLVEEDLTPDRLATLVAAGRLPAP